MAEIRNAHLFYLIICCSNYMYQYITIKICMYFFSQFSLHRPFVTFHFLNLFIFSFSFHTPDSLSLYFSPAFPWQPNQSQTPIQPPSKHREREHTFLFTCTLHPKRINACNTVLSGYTLLQNTLLPLANGPCITEEIAPWGEWLLKRPLTCWSYCSGLWLCPVRYFLQKAGLRSDLGITD